MGRLKSLLVASAAAVVLAGGIAAGQGVLPDRSTIVTISAPVSIPGTVLPAGEYLFKLADTNASRNVVQIFDKDRAKIFATLIAVSAQRNEPEGEAVITFHETPANQPPALHYWYYAGEKDGQEFVYPKSQAIAIARASRESVMAMDTTSSDADAMQKATLGRVDPNSPEVAAAQTQNPAGTPAASSISSEAPRPAAPVETPAPATPTEPQSTTPPAAQSPTPQEPATPPAAAPQAQAPSPAATPSDRPTATAGRDVSPAPAGTSGSAPAAQGQSKGELPKTASDLPTVAMIGIVALCMALGIHAYRRRLLV
jgi:hypothetical protein